MRRLKTWFLAAAAVVVAVGCGMSVTRPAKEPPAGSYTPAAYRVKIGDTIASVHGAAVTLDFFAGAGEQPILGRFFVSADAPSMRQVVALSHDFWTERFASSPAIIGTTMELDGRQTTIVGIAPKGFRFPDGAQIWVPKKP